MTDAEIFKRITNSFIGLHLSKELATRLKDRIDQQTEITDTKDFKPSSVLPMTVYAKERKRMIAKHKFSPRWDGYEKGYYCTVCGVLKEEHGVFESYDPVVVTVSKSAKLLSMFTDYCKKNPEMRFWQALCNWSGYNILASFSVPGGSQQWDTFNMEDDINNWPRPDNGKPKTQD